MRYNADDRPNPSQHSERSISLTAPIPARPRHIRLRGYFSTCVYDGVRSREQNSFVLTLPLMPKLNVKLINIVIN